jgi:hypothetical protein
MNKELELDTKLNALKGKQFLDSLNDVLDLHKKMDKAICEALETSKRKAQSRASFVSKYLHFHAPDAFPLFDSYAKLGLAAKTTNFSSKSQDSNVYAQFCERLAAYITDNRLQSLSLRHIDVDLVDKGSQMIKTKHLRCL